MNERYHLARSMRQLVARHGLGDVIDATKEGIAAERRANLTGTIYSRSLLDAWVSLDRAKRAIRERVQDEG